GQVTVVDRVTDEIPPKTQEIKPHPYGTELGTILKMAKDAKQRKLSTFLQEEFSSVGSDTAKKILDAADLGNVDPKDLSREEARRLHEAFPKVKIMAPPTDCLSPLTAVAPACRPARPSAASTWRARRCRSRRRPRRPSPRWRRSRRRSSSPCRRRRATSAGTLRRRPSAPRSPRSSPSSTRSCPRST